VVLGLQPAGRIHDYVIRLVGTSCLQRIEDHGTRVAAPALPYHAAAATPAPDLQLLDRRGTKGVGGAQHDRALLVLETVGELPDRRRLSRPVHSHHQYHGRRLGHARRSAFASLQDLEQLLANETLQLGGIVQLVALHAFLDALEDFFGRSHPHVRRNQREFQFVEQVAIDLPFALKRVFERGYKARPRFLHTGFQLFEQRGLLLDRAEEGLNHFSSYSNNRDRESAGLGRRGCAATICEGGGDRIGASPARRSPR